MEAGGKKAQRWKVPPGLEDIAVTNPFPPTHGSDSRRTQSVRVGKTQTSIFRVHNKGRLPQQLLAVRLARSGALQGFHNLRLLTSGTSISSAGGSSRSLDVVGCYTVNPNQQLRFQVSFTPAETGCYRARILCDFAAGRLVKHIRVNGGDEETESVPRGRPYTRPKRRKPSSRRANRVPGVPPAAPSFAVRLKWYGMPPAVRQVLEKGKPPPPLEQGGLTPGTHREFFDTLLFVEEYQMEVDIQAYDMERVTMRHTNEGYLALKVPGLAEKRPSLVYRDRIFARQTGTVDTEYEGFVHLVLREEVFLKFDSSFHRAFVPNLRFDVRFSFNRSNLRKQHQALESAVRSVFTFPTSGVTSAAVTPSVRPINRLLNEEQVRAVSEIVAKSGAPPYIIFGPPGTGKTMTVIESILRIRRSNSNAVVLACAPSNEASDLLARHLMKPIAKSTMLRLNAFSRSPESIPGDLKEYCNEFATFPSLAQLKTYTVIVCTFMTVGLLHAQGMPPGHFTHIFLDEAGQGTETETLIPIANLANENTVVVMVGDHQQLGPVIRSPVALKFGLDRSLLQRLISSPPFSAAKGSLFNSRLVTKLLKNYRSHPSILTLPSRRFYGGELQARADRELTYSMLHWEYLPNKKFPLLFIGVEGEDEREDSSPSWFNAQEVSKVVEVVRSLRDMKMNKPLCKDIGVITPYRKQVKKIKASLSRQKIEEITVGTVEQFQGQERRVIIVSTVRSTRDPEIRSFDGKYNLGFLSNPKRFNVAVTRAQALLVVIGNPGVLFQDECWRELMEYCQRNNSWKGTPIPDLETHVETVEDPYGQFGFVDQPWREEV